MVYMLLFMEQANDDTGVTLDHLGSNMGGMHHPHEDAHEELLIKVTSVSHLAYMLAT